MRIANVLIILLIVASALHAQQGNMTARKHFAAVLDDVRSRHGDSVVFFGAITMSDAGGIGTRLDYRKGTSDVWVYTFLSLQDRQLVSGNAMDSEEMGRFIGEVHSQAWPPVAESWYQNRAIRHWWVDSDTAASSWLQTGISAYVDTRPGAEVFRVALNSTSDQGVIWSVAASDGIDTIDCSINAYTTEILDCITTSVNDEVAGPSDAHLGALYPNPVTAGRHAIAELTLPTPSTVSISIHDIQGRLLGYVLRERLPSGASSIVLPGELIRTPGLYFLHMRAGATTLLRKLVVIR